MIDVTTIDNIFKKVCNEYLSTQTGLRLKNKQLISLSDMRLHKDMSFDNAILNVISGSKSFSVKKSTLLDNSFFDTYKAFEKDYLAIKMIADDKLHKLFKENAAQKAAIYKEVVGNNEAYKNAICAVISGCNADMCSNEYNTLFDIQRKALYPIFEKCALAHIEDMRNVDVKNIFGIVTKVDKFLPKIETRTGGVYDNKHYDLDVWLFTDNGKVAVNTLAFFDYRLNPFFIEYKAALDKSDLIMQGYLKTLDLRFIQKKALESIYWQNRKLIDIDFQIEIRELIYNKYPALWNLQAI
jgi:hypothetical protein